MPFSFASLIISPLVTPSRIPIFVGGVIRVLFFTINILQIVPSATYPSMVSIIAS